MIGAQAIPDPPFGQPGTGSETVPSLDQRMMTSKARARRRLVFRTGLMLANAAVLLCFLVTWRRDEMTVKETLRSLGGVAAYLQTQVATLGRLPADVQGLGQQQLEYYLSDSDRFYASQTSEPVIVGMTPLVVLHLKENGRGVITYHQGKIETKWMPDGAHRTAWDQQDAAMKAFDRQRRLRPPELP